MVAARARGALDKYRELLAGRFGARLVELRLFGSYARGDFHEESDVDVLVVIDELSERERREVFDFAYDVFTETLVHVSPLALSVAEWRTLREREYRIAADIEAEGIAL